MKKFLCTIVGGLFFLVALAAAEDVPQLVDTVQNRYNQLHSLTARFAVTTRLASLGKTVHSTGGLACAKGGKLRIEYSTTPPRQYVSDGSRLWVYTDGDPQYLEMALGKAGLPKEALTFLSGFGNLRTLYTIEPLAEDTGKAAQGGRLRLTPKRKSEYATLDATFSAQGLLTALTITQRSGNITTYTFTNLQVDPKLSPDVFRFIPPEGVTRVE